MKITELTGYKNLPAYKTISNFKGNRLVGSLGEPKQYDKLKSDLQKLGWNYLADGTMATVFSNPTKPYVLKIFNDDWGYMRYLKDIKNNKDNPHVPKVYGSGKPVKITDEVFAVRLEKLRPASKGELMKYVDPQLLQDVGSKSNEIAEMIFDEFNYEFLYRHYPKLLDLINITYPGDAHDENVMMRGDTLVLIDV